LQTASYCAFSGQLIEKRQAKSDNKETRWCNLALNKFKQRHILLAQYPPVAETARSDEVAGCTTCTLHSADFTSAILWLGNIPARAQHVHQPNELFDNSPHSKFVRAAYLLMNHLTLQYRSRTTRTQVP
jgi:hypothetical protein